MQALPIAEKQPVRIVKVFQQLRHDKIYLSTTKSLELRTLMQASPLFALAFLVVLLG